MITYTFIRLAESLGADYTVEDVTPLFNDLTGAIDAATSSLSSISPAARLKARQSNDEIANLVAELLSSITDALDGLLDNLATFPRKCCTFSLYPYFV